MESYCSVDTNGTVMLFFYIDLRKDHLAVWVLDCLTGLHLCTSQFLYSLLLLVFLNIVFFYCLSSIWKCNGHFDDWFSNTKAVFVWHMEFVRGETLYIWLIYMYNLILHCSINRWHKCYGSTFMRY